MQALSQLSYTPTANKKLYRSAACLANSRDTLRGGTCGTFPLSSRPPARAGDRRRRSPSHSCRFLTPLPSRAPTFRGARSSSPARPAVSAARWRSPVLRAAPPWCCMAVSCASSKPSTTRSSPPGIRSRRSCHSISPRPRAHDFDNVAGALRSAARTARRPRAHRGVSRFAGPVEHQASRRVASRVRGQRYGGARADPRGVAAARRGTRCVRRVHARRARRRPARVLGRLCGVEGGARGARGDASRRMGNPREPARQRGRSRARCAPASHAHASRRRSDVAAADPRRWCRSICIFSALREGRKRRARRRSRVARGSAGRATARPPRRRAAARSATARAGAGNPPRARVSGSTESCMSGHTTPHDPARQTIVVMRAPTYEASRIEPSRVRPSRVEAVSLRSWPTCSSAGTPRPVQRQNPRTATPAIASSAPRGHRRLERQRCNERTHRSTADGDRRARDTRGTRLEAQARRRLHRRSLRSARHRAGQSAATGRAWRKRVSRRLLAGEQQPRLDDRVRIERHALDALRDAAIAQGPDGRTDPVRRCPRTSRRCGTPRWPSSASP